MEEQIERERKKKYEETSKKKLLDLEELNYHDFYIETDRFGKEKKVKKTLSCRAEMKRETKEWPTRLKNALNYFVMNTVNMGHNKKSLSRDTIKNWKIKTKHIDNSKEQPLTRDIVRREKDKE